MEPKRPKLNLGIRSASEAEELGKRRMHQFVARLSKANKEFQRKAEAGTLEEKHFEKIEKLLDEAKEREIVEDRHLMLLEKVSEALYFAKHRQYE